MEITDFKILNPTQINQAAHILTDELPLGWPTTDDALREIVDLMESEYDAVFFAALEKDDVIGWCGILPDYGGNVYELHPLCVRSDFQRKGVGTALLDAAAAAARIKGGLTLYVGADDEEPGGQTSLANADLYDGLPERIKNFNPGTHQSAFYLKRGFKVVGVVPDANGTGKPDIMLAKKL